MDEIGPWHTGTKTDLEDPSHDTLRQEVLWGSLMAGASGVEWYFGWFTPPNDLNAEDWRSRENMWKMTAYAKSFFHKLPYSEMTNSNHLISSGQAYCLSKDGEVYAIYMKSAHPIKLDLRDHDSSQFSVSWFNPRDGGEFLNGSNEEITGGNWVDIGHPPIESELDWAVLIRKR